MSDDFINMRFKLFEEFGNSREIDINIKGGSAYGVFYTKREYFENWILKKNLDGEARGFFAMFSDRNLLPIAILHKLNVDNKIRGLGIGNNLMSTFLNDASDAKNVVLIADTNETNDFDIIKWYAGWGFTQIGTAEKCPVMVLNNY